MQTAWKSDTYLLSASRGRHIEIKIQSENYKTVI